MIILMTLLILSSSVPEQDHDHYWRLLKSRPGSSLGGPGSTLNFLHQSCIRSVSMTREPIPVMESSQDSQEQA